MADYIERQAAIDAVEYTDWYHQNNKGDMVSGANSAEHQAWYKADDVYNALGSVPSADVQPVRHGVWMEENNRPRSAKFYCSECHRTAYDIQPTRDKTWAKRCRYVYCPNCGARMEQP